MSTPTVIRVESLGKRYALGRARPHDTLRDALMGSLRTAGQVLAHGRRPQDPQEVFWALRDVSFEVARGEVVGIVGSNGAGKSTLLKILSRITKPTVGRVGIRGRVGSLLEVGTGFHAELTGRENLYLSGAILGMRRQEIDRKLEEIVAFAEVGPYLDTPVKHYSSGMYLRLAFAVAAHLEPEILIVDEVLAVGDAAFQRKCLGKMGDVAHEGRTVLFVSHNMDAIRRLCSRCVLLDRGRVAAIGRTEPVISDYLSRNLPNVRPNEGLDLSAAVRTGTREVSFSALRYRGGDARTGYLPCPDGSLEFEFAIISDAARSVESMALTVSTFGGTRLINADIISLGRALRLKEGPNAVRMSIPRLPLNPGRYVVGLWLGDALDTTYDYLEEAFELEVVSAESAGLGVTPASNGVISCPFEVE